MLLHQASFPLAGFVFVALQVQDTMHDKMSIMGFRSLALFVSLALDHRRTNDDVTAHNRLAGVGKGQHVGRVVLAAEVTIQQLPFFAADKAHSDLSAAYAIDIQGGSSTGANQRTQRQSRFFAYVLNAEIETPAGHLPSSELACDS